MEQVSLLCRTPQQDVTFGLKLHSLARALIKLELQVVHPSVQSLQLLRTQELLLFVWKTAQPLDLLVLDFAHVLQSFVLPQQHSDLFLVLCVLIGDSCALFLGLQQLSLDLSDDFVVAVTDLRQLCPVTGLHLRSESGARLGRLRVDLLVVDDQRFALLELAPVLLFFAKEQGLQLALLIHVLVLDCVSLLTVRRQLLLQLTNDLPV